MDFSKALEALKAGKKVTRSTLKPNWIEIRKIQCGTQGEFLQRIILCSPDNNKWSYMEFIDLHVLSTEWEIIEEPQKVHVKTKTVEYITCSNCGKDIDIEPANKFVLCEFCKNEMRLEREFTVAESKYIFDIENLFDVMYFPMRSRSR